MIQESARTSTAARDRPSPKSTVPFPKTTTGELTNRPTPYPHVRPLEIPQSCTAPFCENVVAHLGVCVYAHEPANLFGSGPARNRLPHPVFLAGLLSYQPGRSCRLGSFYKTLARVANLISRARGTKVLPRCLQGVLGETSRSVCVRRLYSTSGFLPSRSSAIDSQSS